MQHYTTNCVSHQNTCNYRLSAIDYNNYIDSYDLGQNVYLIPKITVFIYNFVCNREMNCLSKR